MPAEARRHALAVMEDLGGSELGGASGQEGKVGDRKAQVRRLRDGRQGLY